METLDQIKADAVEVFHFDRECQAAGQGACLSGEVPRQARLQRHGDAAAVTDMIERAYEAGRAEVAGATSCRTCAAS